MNIYFSNKGSTIAFFKQLNCQIESIHINFKLVTQLTNATNFQNIIRYCLLIHSIFFVFASFVRGQDNSLFITDIHPLYKLKGQGQAKPQVVITIAGSVVVAISSAAISSIVVPTATTVHPTCITTIAY